MDNGSTLLNSTVDAHWLGPPGPRLLLELEPAYRVFFSNLADMLLRRQVPQVHLASKPAPYWHDVFVPSGAPWWAVLESVLWHATAVLAVAVLSPAWGPRKPAETRLARRSYVAYYTPNPAFPVLGSRPPRVPVRKEHKLEPRHAMPVAQRGQSPARGSGCSSRHRGAYETRTSAEGRQLEPGCACRAA